MLLVDSVKYNLWIPEKEEQLESMIKEHAKEIFGHDSLYLGIKQKIVSRTGIGSIPDGYLIKFKPLEWYLVEAELSSHSHEHVVLQLSKFMSGIKNFENQREIVEAIYDECRHNPRIVRDLRSMQNLTNQLDFGDVHHLLSKLIGQPPKIVIIIEQEDPDIREACENLRIVLEIIVFKTYVKEGADLKTHAHLFEPIYIPTTTLPPSEREGERRRKSQAPSEEAVLKAMGELKAAKPDLVITSTILRDHFGLDKRGTIRRIMRSLEKQKKVIITETGGNGNGKRKQFNYELAVA